VGTVLLLVGGRSVLAGRMTLGDLVMYVFFTGLLAAPAAQIAGIGTQLSEAFAGLDRIREILGQEREDAHDGAHEPVDAVRGEVEFEDVGFEYEAGRPVLSGVSFRAGAGTTTALVGSSGSGKSTLIRAIAGIWPFGGGVIRVPRDARVLFLPQRPYLPIGALRDVVSYPMPADGVDDKILREALEAVGLTELAGRLDEAAHWALQLSPGEQQRIAFARTLVQKPDWLFLDEATSALDEATEAHLYGLVRERLPETMVFSVGHRTTLGPLHARRLMVMPGEGGPGSIVELDAQRT
jgi:putative ATP-binding cassette transporter